MDVKKAIAILNGAELILLNREWDDFSKATLMAINALHKSYSLSREQVEKLWRGCEQCQPSCGTCEHMYEWDKYGKPQECTSCKENGYVNYISDSKFCEYCGRPLTNEAVQIVMERMEKLYEQTSN